MMVFSIVLQRKYIPKSICINQPIAVLLQPDSASR